ncbi:MAG: protein kinase, partial [Acidobacteria bacterium]|nr:protein kinase [Acidobacteriota bacterium]
VALKLLKRGMDSGAMLRRFRSERQILASLEHSNIARLLDSGMSDDGLPFFALELIEGEPLDKYCRTENLSIPKRLQLFRQICAAVSFAHSRLVVHRDLKPTNILVTREGVPKLLDFGIAKLLSDAPENGIAAATVTKLGMMTPQYASPEQVKGEIAATASDVYSLGLILYELLTSRAPYEFANNRPDEIARVICEIEPKPPSAVVTSEREKRKTKNAKATVENASATTGDISVRRNVDSANRDSKLLRGDLDNIVLKALRKEPNRRYASVEQFSEDIRRHLEGLPVTARAATISYRFEKFVSRNRAAVASGVLLFLTLCAGIGATGWQAVRAERQRVLAEKRFNQVRALANNVVFKYYDGIANLPGSTEVRKMLVNDATEYLDNLSQDADSGDSELLRELANAYIKLADVQGKPYYSNVGDTSGAIENYGKAIAILEILSDSPNIKTKTQAESDLVVAYQTLGMMQTRVFAHTDSIATQRKALALVEAKSASAPKDNDVQYLLVRARGRLADSMREGGQFDEAIKIYRAALALDEEIFRRAPENENAEVAIAVLNDRIGRNLALRAIDLKRVEAPPETYQTIFAEAEERINRMFSGFERLVAAHPEKKKYRRDLSTAYGTLGMVYRETGRLEESSRMLRADLQKRQTVAALDRFDRESQADLSEALTELAQTEAAQKKFSDAFAHFAQAIAIYDRLIATDKANIEFSRLRFEAENCFADALRQNGDIPKALEFYRAAFEKLKTNVSIDNPYFKFAEGLMQEKIGDAYMQQNKFIEAAEAYRKALELWSAEQAKITELGRSPERIDCIRKKNKYK